MNTFILRTIPLQIPEYKPTSGWQKTRNERYEVDLTANRVRWLVEVGENCGGNDGREYYSWSDHHGKWQPIDDFALAAIRVAILADLMADRAKADARVVEAVRVRDAIAATIAEVEAMR